VFEAGGDSRGGPSRSEVYDWQVVAHLTGVVAQRIGVTLTEPTLVSFPPALDGTIVEQGTRVGIVGGDTCSGPSRSEVDGRKVVAHFTGIVAPTVGVSLAKFALASTAPAFDGTVVEQATRMGIAGGDSRGGPSRSEVDGRKVVAHLTGPIAQRIGVSLTELTSCSFPPALDGTIVEQGTRVPVAGGDSRGGPSRSEVYDWQVVAHLTGPIAQRIGVALTEATSSFPPALDRTIVEQGTRVVETHGDCCSGPSSSEVDGRQVVAHFAGVVAPMVGVS